MKKLFYLSIFLLFLFCCKTQQGELYTGNDVVRKVDKEYRHAPPGTVWIRDSIYMDQCEVRNLDYLEYVLWVKKYDSLNYDKVLPDTMVWEEKNTFNKPYVEYYFSHPAYRNYPVVGVSYEQALSFCKWRTDRVKEFIKLKKHSNTIGETFHVKDFHYRLPTKEEWEYAASAESGEDYGFVSMQAKNNSPNFNVKETYMLGYEGFDMTDPVTYKNPNRFGLHNTIGNVAEMITDKGVCKGGSWMNSIRDCEISDSIRYEKTHSVAWFQMCMCYDKIIFSFVHMSFRTEREILIVVSLKRDF